jgi:hypothetical protein
LIHDSAAKFDEAGDKYQFPGACTLAVADMMAWMKSAYPGIAVERKTMYLVVWDRTKQAVCVDSDTMFRFPKESFSPKKYKIRVSKMYELSSSHAMWDMSRDMAGFETVAGFSHDVASIGDEKFVDWGWNQFIIPVGFELRLVDASVM